MEILNIEATKSTPCVVLDSKNHIHSFSGESYPENTSEFYSPIFEWLEEYLASLDSMATFNFEMVYFNSSTSKILMDIFDMFEESSEGGKYIIINWYYDEDNDSALEYGEEFAEDFENLTFNLIEK